MVVKEVLLEFRKYRKWILLVILFIAIKWLATWPDGVEKYYTYGIYPFISRILRAAFGILPFSVGDLFYILLVLYIIFKVIRFFVRLFRKKISRSFLLQTGSRLLFSFLLIYVLFFLLWGLNYSRNGIAYQLQLTVNKQPSIEELKNLCCLLQDELNECAEKTDSTKREQELNNNALLFDEVVATYHQVEKKYSFLQYQYKSIKPSIISPLGKYFSFTGYYNPFSGEAQIKTNVPAFLKPFVACHEVAHQLGYAKENEANFVGFLACIESQNINMRYSAYYDMFSYASSALLNKETLPFYLILLKDLHPIVKRDRKVYRNYILQSKNSIAPIMENVYDQYLKFNNQPNGIKTYDEVVLWLLAYYKKTKANNKLNR